MALFHKLPDSLLQFSGLLCLQRDGELVLICECTVCFPLEEFVNLMLPLSPEPMYGFQPTLGFWVHYWFAPARLPIGGFILLTLLVLWVEDEH